MAEKKSAARAGEAVYRLNFALRVPSEGSTKAVWLPAGYDAGAHELAGLVVPALEHGGMVKQIREPEVPCEFCQEHGTKAAKAERYASPEAMRAHYEDAHPGVTSTEAF